jgi:hypothetical protein
VWQVDFVEFRFPQRCWSIIELCLYCSSWLPTNIGRFHFDGPVSDITILMILLLFLGLLFRFRFREKKYANENGRGFFQPISDPNKSLNRNAGYLNPQTI